MTVLMYTWREPFPSFRAMKRDGVEEYYVELSITCYPYGRGSVFDEMAFPESLRPLGRNGNTNFYFEFRGGPDHVPLVSGSWETAVGAADNLNEAYDALVKGVSEAWEWDALPFSLDPADLLYWK